MCRNLPFYPCTGLGEDVKRLESETFDLLLVTHKFPVLQKVYSKFGPLNNFCDFLKLCLGAPCVFSQTPKWKSGTLIVDVEMLSVFTLLISYPFI